MVMMNKFSSKLDGVLMHDAENLMHRASWSARSVLFTISGPDLAVQQPVNHQVPMCLLLNAVDVNLLEHTVPIPLQRHHLSAPGFTRRMLLVVQVVRPEVLTLGLKVGEELAIDPVDWQILWDNNVSRIAWSTIGESGCPLLELLRRRRSLLRNSSRDRWNQHRGSIH